MEPNVVRVRVDVDSKEAESRLAKMAMVLSTLESRIERAENRLANVQRKLAQTETDKSQVHQKRRG